MYFDRFDIVEAYYAFYCDWHEGQNSRKYERLCKIGAYFSPGGGWMGRDSLSENGREIYDTLVERDS